MARKESQLSVAMAPDLEATRADVNRQVNWGRLYWKPFHDRQDYHMIMYLLLDAIQQLKPVGYRRFISNDPQTAINSAVSILTRNDPYWRIDMPYDMNQPERETVGRIERGLGGIVNQLDSMLLERGEPQFWNQVSWWGLTRGAIWGKFVVTQQAIDWGLDAPLLGEFWDPRWVYPNYDAIGLESVTVEKTTTVNELMHQYGPQFNAATAIRGLNRGAIDPNAPATKVEYWSNDRPGRKGMYAVLGYYGTERTAGYDPILSAVDYSLWLVEPEFHGYRPNALPVIGVPVNGIPLKIKPPFGSMVLNAMNQRAIALGQIAPSWHDPSGAPAEWGRGLLASVEELVPQYNEMVATAMQHFGMNTFPTWAFHTQTGELPDFEDGVNARIPLRIGESVEQLLPHPINTDAYRILDILREEKERGTLNNILQATGAVNSASGIVLQQAINAALNGLHPFSTGNRNFGTVFGSHILEQLRTADVGSLSLVSRGAKSYFRITFDPKADLGERKYLPEPVFKPSVPEDMMLKAQVSRLLLDPRMPVMSVTTVLDRIFQLEDPEGEQKRMLEDIANRDPVLLLERVAQVLEEAGEQDMADRIRQKEFQAVFQEKAQMLEMQAQVSQLMAQMQGAQNAAGGAGGQGAGQVPTGDGLAASSGSMDSTGAGNPRPGQGGPGSPPSGASMVGL